MRGRIFGIGGAALVALIVLAGCSRAPAEEAATAAEEALAASRGSLPERDILAFEQALEQARAALDEGRYTDALRMTQDLPSRIQTARDRAAARRQAAPVEEVEAQPDPPLAGGPPVVGSGAPETAPGSGSGS